MRIGGADSWARDFRTGLVVAFIAGVLGDPRVLTLFARQHWVASTGQLQRLGVSTSAIDRACQIELVERVCPGVYQVSSATLGVEGRCMALLLQSPAGSFISGVTAGRLYGLRRMPAEPVEISVPKHVQRQVPRWARVVECSYAIEQRDVVCREDGLVIASPLRTLFRLASMFNQFRFERAAEDMWHRGLVSPAQATEYLAEVRRSGRSGVARMEKWLKRADVIKQPSQSGLERRLIDLVIAAGLPEPVRQHPLRLLNGDMIHIDMAWPDIRFGLEPGHSWWHGGDLRMRSDYARDRACTEVGWHVQRLDEEAAEDDELIEQIVRMYRQRSLLVLGRSHLVTPRPPDPPAA